MAMAISYNWLFLWDYTFYKWGYKYLYLVKGHNCTCSQSFLKHDQIIISSQFHKFAIGVYKKQGMICL